MDRSTGTHWRSEALRLLIACLAIAGLTSCRYWFGLTNTTIAALGYLMIVLLTATVSTLTIAVATSVLADFSLNYFFMPPVGTFTIADPQNWVALLTFLAVSVVASNLSTAVRDRASEAIARRDELARLFDLSHDVLHRLRVRPESDLRTRQSTGRADRRSRGRRGSRRYFRNALIGGPP
jgi:K+-sensing histidine kinase KdpD